MCLGCSSPGYSKGQCYQTTCGERGHRTSHGETTKYRDASCSLSCPLPPPPLSCNWMLCVCTLQEILCSAELFSPVSGGVNNTKKDIVAGLLQVRDTHTHSYLLKCLCCTVDLAWYFQICKFKLCSPFSFFATEFLEISNHWTRHIKRYIAIIMTAFNCLFATCV